MDISTLSIKVESKGVEESSKKLDNLGNAAAKAEGKVTSFIAAMEKLNAVGKSSSQAFNSFMANIQGSTAAAATSAQKSVDASKSALDKMYRDRSNYYAKEEEQANRMLERQQATLAEARARYAQEQETALRMNAEFDAKRQARLVAMHEEALRINALYDKKKQAAMIAQHEEALRMDAAFNAKKVAQAKAQAEALDVLNMQARARQEAETRAFQERQLRLNSEFAARSVASQVRVITAAAAYGAGGGDVAARYGSSVAAAIPNLDALSRRVDTAARSQRGHNESMREAHALARGLSGSLGALWVTYGNFAGMAAGLAIGVALKGIVSVGKDVENTLEGIRVRGEETTGSVDRMRGAIYSMSTSLYGPREVAKAFDTLIMAGLRAEEALVGIKDALNLATVGGTTIEKSAEVLVQVSTALGFTSDNFGRIGDVIAKAAAVSISSVESISESFKTASVVGKLYGQSLEDIGTEIAILSNLGIKNTAAGTSVKNFFSDLASGTDKVTKGLGMLKLSIKDLQDSEGNFKSFVDVMKTLAGDAEKGFNSLTMANQKYVQTLITNERGNKLMTEGLDLIRRKGEETGSALEDIFKRVTDSYGFAAEGAAAMALTTDAQLKSLKNTIETQFVKTFKDVEPQISLVARRLKEAFSSDEFSSGIATLALSVANLTVFLVENAGAVLKLVEAFVALKVAATVTGTLIAVGAALDRVVIAFKEARLATMAFQASLGLLGIALTAAAAAWVWYNQKKEESYQSDKAHAALAYMDDFKNKLDEENDRLQKQVDLMKKGADAAKALQEAQVAQQIQKVHEQGRVSIEAAEARKKEILAGLSNYQRDLLAGKENANLNDGSRLALQDAQEKVKAANDAVASAKRAAKEAEDGILQSLQKHKQLAKEIADIEGERAKANKPQGGTGTLPPKEDNAAINAAYAAAIKKQAGIIRAAEEELARFEETENARYKMGEISKIKMIEEVTSARINALDVQRQAIEKQMKEAEGKKNGDSDVQQFQNDLDANYRAANAARAKQAEDINVILAGYAKANTRTQIAELEAQGQYVKAASLRWSSEYSSTFKELEKSLEEYGSKYPEIVKYVENLRNAQNTMVAEGKFKEMLKEFDTGIITVGNSLRAVVAENESSGISAMWQAATEASAQYKAQINSLKEEQKALAEQAALTGNPADAKRAAEAETQIKTLTNHYKTMWESVGKHIGDSLEGAFGKGGKALNNLVQLTLKYNDGQKKSTSESLKFWGDNAQAAAGFFNENSKGYQTMMRVSQAFHLAEMAQSVVRMGQMAIEAVLNQAKGDPYSAFARMAAMAAIVAALGFAVSGGSGVDVSKQRQDTQGTGSVFGDTAAKSDSIAKSLTILKDNSNETMPISQGMLAALNNIQNGLGALGNLLVRNTDISKPSVGSLSPGFGSTSAGAASMAATGAAIGTYFFPVIGTAIGAVVGYIASKIPVFKNIFTSIFGGKQSVTDSGFTVDKSSLSDAMSNGVNAKSYADITTSGGWFSSDKHSTQTASLGDEANKQFGQIVKSMADGIAAAGSALGQNSDEFLKHLDSFVIDIGNVSLKGLTGDEIQKQVEAVFSKLGDDMAKYAFSGLESFQRVGEGYFETFIRVASGVEQAKVALDKLCITAIDYTDIINKQGDVATEIARQSIVATEGMTNVGKMIEQFSGSLSELTAAYQTLLDIRRVMKNVGISGDVSTSMIQGAGGAKELTNSLSTYFDKFFTESEKIAAKTSDLATQFGRLGLVMPSNIEEFRRLVTSIGTATPEAAKLTGQVLALAEAFADVNGVSAAQAMKDAGARLLANVDAAFAVLQKVIKAESDVINARITKEKALVDSLKSTLDTMTAIGSEMSDRVEAQAQIKTALAIVKAGGPLPDAESLKKALSVVAKDASSQFISMQDYLEDFHKTKNDISELNEYANDSLSVDQKQLDALNEMLKQAQQQVDLLKGIDTNGLTVVQALEALKLAIAGAQANPYVNSTQAINDAYKSSLGRTADSAGMQYWQDKVASGTSIEEVVSSISNSAEARIKEMYKSVLGRDADAAGLDYWVKQANGGTPLSAIKDSLINSDENKLKIPAFANGGDFGGGIRMVGDAGPEIEVTGPSRIISNQEIMARMNNSGNDEVAAEIRALRGEVAELRRTNSNENYYIAKYGKNVSDHLDNAVYGGVGIATKAETKAETLT